MTKEQHWRWAQLLFKVDIPAEDSIYYFIYVHTCASVSVYATYVWVPAEARKECWIPFELGLQGL